jgi:hypothetical protein
MYMKIEELNVLTKEKKTILSSQIQLTSQSTTPNLRNKR